MTPHINAKEGEIAKIALLAGDPLRAKGIAEKYLENVKLVNTVRNMFMYTGEYHGIKVTVGGHGMGIPSIGIYSYELYKFYDVDYIIRIGSCGSYDKNLHVYDVFNVKEAVGENDFFKNVGGLDTRVNYPSKDLFNLINQVAKENDVTIQEGIAQSSDVFYHPEGFDPVKHAKDNHFSVVEMESYALFANAYVLKKQAACLLTVSDSFVNDEFTTPEERQTNFNKMVELALDVAVKIATK